MRIAWRIIADHPLGASAPAPTAWSCGTTCGAGLGKWLFIVHNAYLLRWAETGIFGLLSLFSVCCSSGFDSRSAAVASAMMRRS